jgi:hypothetical protein
VCPRGIHYVVFCRFFFIATTADTFRAQFTQVPFREKKITSFFIRWPHRHIRKIHVFVIAIFHSVVYLIIQTLLNKLRTTLKINVNIILRACTMFRCRRNIARQHILPPALPPTMQEIDQNQTEGSLWLNLYVFTQTPRRC